MSALAHPRRLLALVAALIMVALLSGGLRPHPAAAQPETPADRILVLRGGNAASDNAVIRALSERGLDVVSGPESTAFNGPRGALDEFDVVVVLYNANWQTPMRNPGVNEIERFVRKGGGLVAGEWVLWRSQLAPLMPATHCGWNNATSTTLERVSPHARVDEGLPEAFSVSLGNYSGSESCLLPKEDATVLYSSSNGGGREGSAGLVAWNYEKGRVAAFSTLLSATELQGADYRRLFQNTVEWVARTRDTSPPRITGFEVQGAGGLVGQRELQIRLTARDKGGSGVGGYFVREYVFSGDPADGWVRAGNSGGWQPYQQPGAEFTYTLSAKPGVHYLQAFVADRAGNVSRRAAIAFVNYAPDGATVAQGETQIFRFAPGAGVGTAVTMTVPQGGGDPDLYVFGPIDDGVDPRLKIALALQQNLPVEEQRFAAVAGTYQVEVHGETAGSYSLRVATGVPVVSPQPTDATIERRPRITITSVEPPQPAEETGTLPEAPIDPGAEALMDMLYLPALRR
jgi:hypothetical protein